MEVWEIILYTCLWQTVGFVMWITLGGCFNVQVIKYSFGIEFVNPLVIYKQTGVNWFGAFFSWYALWSNVPRCHSYLLAL